MYEGLQLGSSQLKGTTQYPSTTTSKSRTSPITLGTLIGRKSGKNSIGYPPHLSSCKRPDCHGSRAGSGTELSKRENAFDPVTAREKLSERKNVLCAPLQSSGLKNSGAISGLLEDMQTLHTDKRCLLGLSGRGTGRCFGGTTWGYQMVAQCGWARGWRPPSFRPGGYKTLRRSSQGGKKSCLKTAASCTGRGLPLQLSAYRCVVVPRYLHMVDRRSR